MPCYKPLLAYYSKKINDSGKRPLVFNTKDAMDDGEIELPCGRCIGCRLEKSRQWAVRCVHENSMHEESAFLTLTYDDDHLPKNDGLVKKDWQDFLKRYRMHLDYKRPGHKIRFYMCGEYGDQLGRPHYHALIFGHDFSDKENIEQSQSGDEQFTSKKLDKLWGKGRATIGTVTFESAAYIARYIVKKQSGEQAEKHYQKLDRDTGEICDVIPEFTLMSRRPGIGVSWLNKFKTDLRKGYITVNGIKMRPPKAYDEILKKLHWKDFDYDGYKFIQTESIKIDHENSTRERLDVREKVQQRKLNKLKREIK